MSSLPALSGLRRPAVVARGQRGTMSVEFAIIFPALFLILYAIITYGLIFAAQQSLTLAAAEGGRAALRYQKAADATAALTLRMAASRDAALAPLTWLQGVSGNALTVTPSQAPCVGATTLTCIRVRVTYDYARAPLVPHLLGSLLALPTPPTLSSESVVQISASHLL